MDVVVVGSLNLDTTIRVPHLPRPGETVLGISRFSDSGGKGANQAVAAARLGAGVAMVGRVGDDAAGVTLRSGLAVEGIDVAAVETSSDLGTGMAVITVDDSGENAIVVDPGANGSVGERLIADHAGLIGDATVVLLQLEIPLHAVAAAATATGGTLVLNPAPAAHLDRALLERIDVLVPNATELAHLAASPVPKEPEEAIEAARMLHGPRSVVVTLGAAGAVVITGDHAERVPAPTVEAVDPTAAGDAFCGGLADALVRGADLVEATGWAVRCGAVTATRWGAQSALPTRSEVEAMEGK